MPTFPVLERRRAIQPSEPHQSHTHKFSIDKHLFYLRMRHYSTADYETGEIGAIELHAEKEEAAVNGLLDGLSKTTTLGLQYGVPLENLVQEWKGSRFEPMGFTNNRHIPYVKSLTDYVATYVQHYQVVFPYQPFARQQCTLSDLNSINHKFSLDGREGYITCSFYHRESIEPARVGKLKIEWAGEGSTVNGLMRAIFASTSMGLQYGVPLRAYCQEWKGLSFPPSGMTQESQHASSVLDYAANFLIKRLELEK